MKKYTGALAIIALLINGCATLNELRAYPPTRTETYKGNHKDVATCVAEAIDSWGKHGVPQLRINEKLNRSRIFKVFEPSGEAMYDFDISQIDDYHIKIESRGMTTIYGRETIPNRIWPFVEKCTGDFASN